MLRPPTGPTGPTAPSSPQGGQSGRGPQGKRFGAPSGGGLRLELEEGEQVAEGIAGGDGAAPGLALAFAAGRSEEHTSELQSRGHLVCRLLLEKKNEPKITEQGECQTR